MTKTLKENQLRLEKYYQVFDIAFDTEEKALDLLDGWEHKEKVHTIYIIMNGLQERVEEINLADNDYFSYGSYEAALTHIKEEIEYLK